MIKIHGRPTTNRLIHIISRGFFSVLEESSYAQVVRIRRKKWCRRKIRKTPKRKYLFQGKSLISKHWFDLYIEWIEGNFSTRKPQFYKRLFQINIEGQAGSKCPKFPVPDVNVK